MGTNRPKPIPETWLQERSVEHGKVGLVESAIAGDQARTELELDIQTLIQRGFSDEKIAEDLDLQNVDIVQYFRFRLAEMQNDR
jgi:hypothetical protein